MKTTNTQLLTIGVEDGSFPVDRERRAGYKTLLVATLLEEFQLKDLRLGVITVDGVDATDSLLSIINSLSAKPSLVMLAGISYGGFNYINPFRIKIEGNLPSIVVTMGKPDNENVRRALQLHFPDWKERWGVYRRLKNFQPFKANPTENPIFMETIGLTRGESERILGRLTRIGRMPEPLRAARMIARGLTVEPFLEILNS